MDRFSRILLALIVFTTSALATPRPVTVAVDAAPAHSQTLMKQFGLGFGGCAVIAGSAALRLRRRRALLIRGGPAALRA